MRYLSISLVLCLMSVALLLPPPAVGPKLAVAGRDDQSPVKQPPAELRLSRADYVDRVQAVWTAQIAAVLLAWPHEHQTASVLWLRDYPREYTAAPVDDDWYYEMCAIRGFEKYGIGMTAAQLGEQWKENNCGSWGSSEQALLALRRGIKAPETGHPRYNKLWFTIGPQFSSEVYGALAPGMPNLAGQLAREFGHVNGYAEAVDGAVFMAGMVSLGFVEKDTRAIVKKAASLIHPTSPYRQCLDQVITAAEGGKSFQQVVSQVEDRWHIEYPATNNAVANGGIVAAALWFGKGDFLATVNLAAGAADFTDADCNAANAAAVVAAMHGMEAIPRHLVAALGDRIVGDKMGPLKLTPPVDEKISDLARRTAAVGVKMLKAYGAKVDDAGIVVRIEEPATQPAELFQLADLTKYWNPDWTLERAGFGGAGGGMGGIRGITHLDGDVLATYPRDEVRGVVLRRTVKLGEKPSLSFRAGVDPGRAWELNVYVDNKLLSKKIIEAPSDAKGRHWQALSFDLTAYAGKLVHLRLYQRVLLPGRTAGNAYWKALVVE
jgi:ADP-ribosylglycohydrolase